MLGWPIGKAQVLNTDFSPNLVFNLLGHIFFLYSLPHFGGNGRINTSSALQTDETIGMHISAVYSSSSSLCTSYAYL